MEEWMKNVELQIQTAKNEGFWAAERLYMQKLEDLEREMLFNPVMKEDEREFYLKGLVKQF